MKVLIIGGGNGMLSNCIGTFLKKAGCFVEVIGKTPPMTYIPDAFIKKNLLEDEIYFSELLNSDVIVYAAGAGVQATVPVEIGTMYEMNLRIPIKLCLLLNKYGYKGAFVSFGSYMEIGCNNEMYKSFNEDELIYSRLPVTNDYALSKRLLTHYMHYTNFIFNYYHFILPNLFSRNEKGTRLLPYVINYLKEKKQNIDIELPRFSAGFQIRQYVYIEEVIDTILKCITGKIDSGVYNIGGGQIASIREFVTELFLAFGVNAEEQMFGKEVRRDNDILSLSLDDTKLFKAINVSQKVRMTDIYHD